MLIVRKERYDSALDAQIAQYTSPDPRIISNVESVQEGIDIASQFIADNQYKGTVEVIDYTPYTAFSSAKTVRLKTVQLKNKAIQITEGK